MKIGDRTGIGIEAEDRPFHPHLTLSRIRPPQNVASILDAGEAISVTWPADHLTIYSSTPGSGGARYETLETFAL